jgi:hypothetical protein
MCSSGTDGPTLEVEAHAPWEVWESDLADEPLGAVGQWQQADDGSDTPWHRLVTAFPFEPAEQVEADDRARILVAQLRACEALTTQLDAQKARALRELRQIRLLQQAAQHPHGSGGCPSACCDEDGWVAPEVAVELALSERQVMSRLDTARRLERHPAVEAAMDAGRLQGWTATRLLEHLHTLGQYVPPDTLAAVEAATLAWLLTSGRTVTELNARMRRLILAARAAADRDGDPGDEGCHARRRVTVAPASTPGLAELVALLPEADALTLRATLHALARDRVGGEDTRSVDQRRADLLVTLVTGAPARHGRPEDAQCALRGPAQVQVRLDVTVPMDSLAAGGGAPAEVPGYGAIPAATARDLADSVRRATSCTGRPLVYEPSSGRLLGFAASPVPITWLDGLPPSRGYQHSPALQTAVRLRDGSCRAPGCTRAAARCDCDHAVPYPAGDTSLGNSCSLCRRHHRMKTHARAWRLHMDAPTGEVTWTAPTGRRLISYLHDYRPPDLCPPPDSDPPPF